VFILIMVYVLAGSPRRTFCIEGSVFRRYQRPTLRLLPAGATVAGWVIFLPLDRRALSTARVKPGLSVFDHTEEYIKPEQIGTFQKLRRAPQNFFKHADKDPEETFEFIRLPLDKSSI